MIARPRYASQSNSYVTRPHTVAPLFVLLLAVHLFSGCDACNSLGHQINAAEQEPAVHADVDLGEPELSWPDPVPGSRQPIELGGQDENARVRMARANQNDDIMHLFAGAGVTYPPRSVFLRAFKNEGDLELWAQPDLGEPYRLIKAYEFCTTSGQLGPKRRQGDRQIPEGVYRVTGFNPASRYHLSIRINYPNASDVILGGPNLGGDIFIHGNCASIGCIPIGDNGIEELYVVLSDTRRHGARQPIHVYIFPLRMDKTGMAVLQERCSGSDKGLRYFWDNLKEVHDTLELMRFPPVVTIDETGRYVVHGVPDSAQ